MLGATLALAGGLHQRHGWRIAGMAAIASALPDWDGLSILFGPVAYAQGHRTWGHNVFAAVFLGGLTGGLAYLFSLTRRFQSISTATIRKLIPQAPPPPSQCSVFSASAVVAWTLMGAIASLSHLPADLVYSGHRDLPDWPMPLLWPLSNQGWSLPIVPWGDLGATVIFIGEMFVLYRWPRHTRLIAWLTLAAVVAYVGTCWRVAR